MINVLPRPSAKWVGETPGRAGDPVIGGFDSWPLHSLAVIILLESRRTLIHNENIDFSDRIRNNQTFWCLLNVDFNVSGLLTCLDDKGWVLLPLLKCTCSSFYDIGCKRIYRKIHIGFYSTLIFAFPKTNVVGGYYLLLLWFVVIDASVTICFNW